MLLPMRIRLQLAGVSCVLHMHLAGFDVGDSVEKYKKMSFIFLKRFETVVKIRNAADVMTEH